MRTLNEDAIEYAANNLFTTELGYTEIIWGPEIAPEGARMQEREFNEVVLRGRQRHSLRRMRLVKIPSAAIGMIVANTKQGRNRFFAKSIGNHYLSQKITLMEPAKANMSLEKWVEQQLSLGKYGFALSVLRNFFDEQTETALKFALKRLADKGKILSVYKGYYLILPPPYSSKGILPPTLFLDTFMKFLERPYYVALLNAAAYHGASHQRPQEYFVMTNFPVLRATHKKGMKINYISVKQIPVKLLEQRKTEAGYLTISNAALTATDLVHFEKRIGGLNRAATVLNELADVLQPVDFNTELLDYAPTTALQRLGYLLEFASNKSELADALFDAMEKHPLNCFRIPLKSSGAIKGFSSENRWKVIVNTEIEIDE